MSDSFRLGLTGSIAMGKSTTAAMFAEEGLPVWDADAAVHRIYAPGGGGADAIRPLCPDSVTEDGAVDRTILKRWLQESEHNLAHLEMVVHPLVAEDRMNFLRQTKAPIVLHDIPLLYETGADTLCDAVVVVSVPPEVQRDRVMGRPGMTEAYFRSILRRQMPDAEKRERADYIVETLSLESARSQVQDVLKDIQGGL